MVKEIVSEVEAKNKNADSMGGKSVVVEKKPNPLVDGLLEWGNIDFDAIVPNSVILVKVNSDDPEYSHGFQMGVIKHILEPRFKMLKEKKVTVLFMTDKDSIEILTEADMAKAGWQKIEKSLIIKPSDL